MPATLTQLDFRVKNGHPGSAMMKCLFVYADGRQQFFELRAEDRGDGVPRLPRSVQVPEGIDEMLGDLSYKEFMDSRQDDKFQGLLRIRNFKPTGVALCELFPIYEEIP